jgi:hypothetical protein
MGYRFWAMIEGHRDVASSSTFAMRVAFAAPDAPADIDVDREATWRDELVRLTKKLADENAARVVAEACGDQQAATAANAAWNDTHDAMNRLTEEHLDEIDADYGELWDGLDAAREAERISSLCTTACACSRRPAQARRRARRTRRVRSRRAASSTNGDGEPPSARRDRGAPARHTSAVHVRHAGRLREERTP